MEITLAKVPLPCSAVQLENAILRAAHNGHWHDAEVKVHGDKLVKFTRTRVPDGDSKTRPSHGGSFNRAAGKIQSMWKATKRRRYFNPRRRFHQGFLPFIETLPGA